MKQEMLVFVGMFFAVASVQFAGAQSEAEGKPAGLRLPSVLGDHMVLQRDVPVPIWGWAEPGEKITVQLDGQEVAAQAGREGKWMVKLSAMEAGGPHELIISGKQSTIRLKDILVGEVWLCSGQSNMEWGIRNVNHAQEEIAQADYPNMRLFQVPWKTSGRPESDLDAQWRSCTPKNVSTGGWMDAGFSAVAYFFGRQLHRELGVPIGLIDTSWGGTRIEPWTPPEGFVAVPELRDVVQHIEEAEPRYEKALRQALDAYEDWVTIARKGLDKGKPVPPQPEWPRHPLDHNAQPTGIYNAMVHPLVPFALRGAIWYQGESNKNDGSLYRAKMEALIRGWRKIWGLGDFPFYYVQLAPLDDYYGIHQLPILWEAQTAALSIPNTGMVVTTDITDLHDIHPRNKQDVGKRLALWALAKTYGKSDLVYSGPLYQSMDVEEGKIRLRFDHTGSGLAARDGKPLDWFEVAGADQRYVTAEAKIDGDTVLVWSEEVPEPVAVRFAWSRKATPNLMNKEGLPASPFRTERWEYRIPESGPYVRHWNVVGPFAFGMDDPQQPGWHQALPPEKEVDLQAAYSGKRGETVRWQAVRALESGYVDLDALYRQEDDAVAFAAVYVHSPARRGYEMRAGSDDSLAVRVNGQEVWRQAGARGAVPDDDVFEAELEAGWNEVLLKVAEFWGGWGFFFRIVDPKAELRFALKPDHDSTNQ